MLELSEKALIAGTFGAADAQVERDHFISHTLAAIASLNLPIAFFGGTALARTILLDPNDGARLSEDIDLFTASRSGVAGTLDRELPMLIRREYPRTGWDPPLSKVKSEQPAQLVSGEGLRLRIQLLNAGDEHSHLLGYPSEIREVALRYRDLPDSVPMRVPTAGAFAAMKTAARMDRRTARDLFDLAGLATLNKLDRETTALVKKISGLTVQPHFFIKPPADWQAQLAHQTGRLPSAEECLSIVRAAFGSVLSWDDAS
jgi:predicted nucleotidyltransferase component of viral defense system